MNSQLTLKAQRFVDAYLGISRCNATDAAFRAGYGSTRPSARVLGHRLLTKVNICQAIYARATRERTASILSAEQRDEHLSALVRSPIVPPAQQISAIKEMNKCSGRHSIKHVLDVKETLASIIAGSRRI